MPRTASGKAQAKAKSVGAPKGKAKAKAQVKRAAGPPESDAQPPAQRARQQELLSPPGLADQALPAASAPEVRADGLNDLMALKGGSYVNANIWDEVDRSMSAILAAVPGLVQKDAPVLLDGDSEQEGSGNEVAAVGIQASFSTKAFRRSMRNNREYKCAQNFFRHAMSWTSAPAVLDLDCRRCIVRCSCNAV